MTAFLGRRCRRFFGVALLAGGFPWAVASGDETVSRLSPPPSTASGALERTGHDAGAEPDLALASVVLVGPPAAGKVPAIASAVTDLPRVPAIAPSGRPISPGNAVPEARSIPKDRAQEEPPPRRRRPRDASPALPPWVGVDNLSQELSSAVRLFERSESRVVPPYALFGDKDFYEEAPNFVAVPKIPLFHCPPPAESKYARALTRIARRKAYSEIRRRMKSEWRRAFRESPSMRYEFYEKRLVEIDSLGKDENEIDLFGQRYFSNQAKNDIFGRTEREGEEDFPLIEWGPFVVMDSGSMRLDLGRVVDMDSSLQRIGLKDEETAGGTPLLASREYSVRTRLRLDMDPIEAYDRGDVTWVIERYGLEFEVDWFSDVLGRDALTAEFDMEFDRSGDFACMVNFVVKSRK